ncbi:sulfatase family protein [Cerasicoccus fimbriatus]|uniref:sulfatase family protein n=1 Tax=Cerasicoccus fimbriatus TaxID=3014554 RepID=UPI0022B312E2|nr:sulfatase [Cerasicoccus sp. TK19100]
MKKPNVIWFVCDQMRGQATGYNGDPNVFTPNLDNMAICGAAFPQAVSGYPLCCPFRASMLTGRYAHNHSVKIHEDKLETSYQTIADVFNEHDYETIYLGKWHLAGMKEREGRTVLRTVAREDRFRFDTWIGYENNNSQWDLYLHGHEGDEEIPHFKLIDYETDALTDMALERIKARKDSDKPFFMVVSVQPPHVPCLAPPEHRRYQAQQLELRPNVSAKEEDKARFDLSGYYAQIENIDHNVGRIIETLRVEEMIDDTHVIFFSDHGDQMGSQGAFGKCVPYEESARVPFLIGGGQPMNYYGLAGKKDCLINHVDIAPTTLGICGIETPDWMEGFDYSHRRTGKEHADRVHKEPDSAFLQLIGDRESGYAWRCVITRDGWKYAAARGRNHWLMYDLNNDPYEQTNLAFNTWYYQKRCELKALLQDWIDKTGDDFELPED